MRVIRRSFCGDCGSLLESEEVTSELESESESLVWKRGRGNSTNFSRKEKGNLMKEFFMVVRSRFNFHWRRSFKGFSGLFLFKAFIIVSLWGSFMFEILAKLIFGLYKKRILFLKFLKIKQLKLYHWNFENIIWILFDIEFATFCDWKEPLLS